MATGSVAPISNFSQQQMTPAVQNLIAEKPSYPNTTDLSDKLGALLKGDNFSSNVVSAQNIRLAGWAYYKEALGVIVALVGVVAVRSWFNNRPHLRVGDQVASPRMNVGEIHRGVLNPDGRSIKVFYTLDRIEEYILRTDMEPAAKSAKQLYLGDGSLVDTYKTRVNEIERVRISITATPNARTAVIYNFTDGLLESIEVTQRTRSETTRPAATGDYFNDARVRITDRSVVKYTTHGVLPATPKAVDQLLLELPETRALFEPHRNELAHRIVVYWHETIPRQRSLEARTLGVVAPEIAGRCGRGGEIPINAAIAKATQILNRATATAQGTAVVAGPNRDRDQVRKGRPGVEREETLLRALRESAKLGKK